MKGRPETRRCPAGALFEPRWPWVAPLARRRVRPVSGAAGRAVGSSFDLIRRHHRHNDRAFLYAFDLIELNGDDLRRDPLQVRKATLRGMLAKAGLGLRFNEHMEGDGPTVFATPASSALKALSQSARIPPTAPAARPTGSK